MIEPHREHEDLRSLLGAYALDALSPLEHRRVQRHLEACPDCARETRLLVESAAELAILVGDEEMPSDLIDRVMAAIPASRRAGRPRMRMLVAAAVAAVLAVLGSVGTGYIRERSRSAEFARVVAGADREVRFQPVAGFTGRGALYLADGKAAVVLEKMPPAGPSRSYQLWSLRGGVPSSMTVIGGRGRIVVVVPWRNAGDAFAVTVEPEGGSERPTTSPALLST